MVAAVLFWTAATPAAEAHTVTGVAPTNYASEVLFLRPRVDDVTVRVLDLGRRVELVNRGRQEVVVLGYSGEPYLRVGRSGVFENRRSPSTYLNRPPTATGAPVKVPPTANASATPEWRRVNASHRARWRDRRTRVERTVTHPKGKAVVSTWALEFRRASAPFDAIGRITYVPPPAPLPWVALMLVLAGLTIAAAWTRRWGRILAVALAVLIATDAIQSIGSAAATHDPLAAQAAKILLGGLVTTIAWVAGVVSIGPLQRNHEGGLVAAGGIGLLIAMFSGVTDLGSLSHSQVASTFPAVWSRIAAVSAVGLGLGLLGATVALIARDENLRPKTLGGSAGTSR